MTRRDLLRLAVALPVGASFAAYRAIAAAHEGEVKITAVKALEVTTSANALIKIETDAGLVGYGEAGADGPMARARIKNMKPALISRDPLSIEKIFIDLTSRMHPYLGHIPTISGIDIALWDLAGKILNQPVHKLLGGPFRTEIPMYSHGGRDLDMQDPPSCRAWAAEIKAAPERFRAFKIGVHRPSDFAVARYAYTLDSKQVRDVARGFMNVREAVGDEIDIAIHGHNELDPPSAVAVGQATKPMRPLFYEDPLPVHFSDGWKMLKANVDIPLLIGEKLELTRQFRPFIDEGVADIVHPDLAFAGGITGTKKIADYAMLSRTPVALHNVGTLVLTAASAQFAASIHNFYRSESALGRNPRIVEPMAAGEPPEVAEGKLKVAAGPGLGIQVNEDFIREKMRPGEPWWS